MQNRLSLESNKKDIGKIFKVLIESSSKKSDNDWMGRTSENKVMIFSKGNHNYSAGDYVYVKTTSCTQGTLLGNIVNSEI